MASFLDIGNGHTLEANRFHRIYFSSEGSLRAAQTLVPFGCRPVMETVQNTPCALVGCNTVDFLPIICPLCALSFCKEHSFEDKHFCSKSAVQSEAVGEGIDNLRIPCSLLGCSDPSLAFKSQPDSAQLACPSCNLFFCIKYGPLSARTTAILTYDTGIVIRRTINVPNWRLR